MNVLENEPLHLEEDVTVMNPQNIFPWPKYSDTGYIMTKLKSFAMRLSIQQE